MSEKGNDVEPAFVIKTGDEMGGQDEYEILVGPDGFECWLTEIEDRCWRRDLRPVLELLNKQHTELVELRAAKEE